MSYLRHPQLAAWAVLLALLVGVLAFAQHRGGQEHAPAAARAVLGPPGPARSAARIHVEELRALAQPGIAAGSQGSALTSWAQEVAEKAHAGAQVRHSEGATKDDPLYTGLATVARDAEHVSAVSNDMVASAAGRTRVLLDVDHVTYIVKGLPAPELPAAPTDPLSTKKRAEAGTPSPDSPTRPEFPSLTGTGGPLPTPVHGFPASPPKPTLPALPDPSN